MAPDIEIRGSAYDEINIKTTENLFVDTPTTGEDEGKIVFALKQRGKGGKDQIVDFREAVDRASRPEDPSMEIAIRPSGNEKIYLNGRDQKSIGLRISSAEKVKIEPLS